MMHNSIVIVGAGGFGKEVCGYLQQDLSCNVLTDFIIKGVLDDKKENYVASGMNIPYLGKIKEIIFFSSEPTVYVVVAIGNTRIRNKIIDYFCTKDVKFLTYIHSTAIIASDAIIGDGVFVGPYCIVNAQSTIKDHCVLNTYASVGHDSVLGERSILSPYCTLTGDVQTGKNLFMGTRSSLLPGTIVGDNCMIAAHTNVHGSHGDHLIFKQDVPVQVVPNRFY